jgi:hypothetical protein
MVSGANIMPLAMLVEAYDSAQPGEAVTASMSYVVSGSL